MDSLLQCAWEEVADEHLQTKDPYYDSNGKRRKAPPGSTEQEIKAWNKVRRLAWRHDRCACDCGCNMDCGLGSATLISIVPVLGPMLVYVIHMRLIEVAHQNMKLDDALLAKMYSNILFDFLITLPPILGTLLGYLHACSTRNAALIHTKLKKVCAEREKMATVMNPRSMEYSGEQYQNGVVAYGNGNGNFYGRVDANSYGRVDPGVSRKYNN